MTVFSKLVRAEEIQASGVEWRAVADEPTRAAIAARLEIPRVDSFSGLVALRRDSGVYVLTGHIDAVLQRLCVASLEPMQERVSEDFSLRFSPDVAEGGDIDPEAPEPIPEEGFDLAEILIQQLALAMDPYPHMEGASSLAEDHGQTGSISPFEALKGAFAARRDKE